MADIDLRAQVVNITVTRGDAWSLLVTLKDPDGDPIDLTAKTVAAQLRARPDATDSTALTVTAVDWAQGQFTISQAAATLAGYYDVQVTSGSLPRTYFRGRLILTKDVTRP